ncbi:MAG: Gfo/Idh/MocA family oxidoreductase [Sedimentisphaerales bacterium]|nr:Gfo/Idh/MocA family oxidoreductase [Sedimentisphaerales bacterium]
MLKGAVIGFGRMGLTHFSILNNHPEVEFVAVCDSSSFILQNVAKYMGLATFTDHRKMFDSTNLDFAIIATPTVLHADAVDNAIEKGLHVFVEKPFGLNPEQGQKLIDKVKGKKIVTQVGYVIRFNDVMMEVKKLLNSNVIGDLLVFKMEMNGPTVLHDVKSGWRSKKTEGGGCLYDFASHSIDLINYLIGPPDKIVGSVLQSIHSAGIEDAVTSTFVYNNGLRGNLLVNWSDPSYRKPAYRFEIQGKKGKIVADLHAYKIFFRDPPSTNGFKQGWNQRYVTSFVEPVRFYVRGFEFTRQLDYFIECITQGKPNQMCTFEDGLAADKVISQIRKNAN